MNVELIHEFTIIAKYKNLSEAAKELHSTQPALSKHLATLEMELGVELFNRESQPMQLTPAGEALLSEACGLIAKNAQLLTRLNRVRQQPNKKVLTIASGLVYSQSSLLVDQVARRYGPARFSCRYIPPFSHLSLQLLRKDAADLAIEPFSEALELRGIESVPLYKEKMVVITEKTHRLATTDTIQFTDLIGEKFVSLNNNCDTPQRHHITSLCEKYEFPGKLPSDFEFRDMLSYTAIFVQGLNGGIIVLPESCYRFLPIFTLDQYKKTLIANLDCCYDMRLFYKAEREKELDVLLSSMKKHIAALDSNPPSGFIGEKIEELASKDRLTRNPSC